MKKLYNREFVGVSGRLTAILLAFLFLITPFAPVFAIEQDVVSEAPAVTAPEETSTPITESPTEATPAPTSDPTVTDPTAPIKEEEPSPNSLSSISSSEPSKFDKVIRQQLPQINEPNGSLVYEYPLTIPPGRNGLHPDVKLVYNSQPSAEDVNLLGYGWSTNIPYIERINRKGSEKLYTENYFNSSLVGELVSTGTDTYGAKVDNGEFLSHTLTSNIWTVKDKKGTVYKFGTNAAERQDNPSDSTKIYKWMLQEVRDTNNNYIKYEYFKDSGQIYPSKIIYTGNGVTDGIFEIEFLRETRTDVTKSDKPAFRVTTNYRLSEIQAKVSGSWVRKYALAYSNADNGRRAVLNTITETGRDETTLAQVSLPANDFDYQIATSGTGWQDNDSSITYPEDFRYSILGDVNGDGLSDLMYSRSDVRKTYIQSWNGSWTLNSNFQPPVNFYNGSADECVRGADVNGDGLLDLLKYDAYNSSLTETWLNNGNGWTTSVAWRSPRSFCHSGGDTHGSNFSHLVDINGDALVDVIQAWHNGSEVSSIVYLNNGNGWQDNPAWTIPVDLRFGVFMGDINNDGLMDLLYHRQGWPTPRAAWLNNGKGGWVDDTNFWPYYDMPFYANNADQGVRLFDFTGDGFPDLSQHVDGGSKRNFINTGNGWTLGTTGWDSPVAFQQAGSSQDQGVRIVDLNGDGMVDIIRTWGSPLNSSTRKNAKSKADLKIKITYPQGGSSDIVYKATPLYRDGSNNLLNPKLSFVLDTVSSITHNNGLGNSFAVTNQYESGLFYYSDAYDRKLAGFEKIQKTNGAGHITKNFYHQGNTTNSSFGEFDDHVSKIGKIYRTEILDNSSNIFSKTINKWEHFNITTGRDFVKMTQAIDMTYDGNAFHKDKAETYTYSNSNGNLTQKVEWGEVTGTDSGTFTDSGTDKFTTDISYASNTGANILELPSQETKTDQSANKVKESKFYYDSLALGSVNVGNLTKKEDWKTGTTYIDIEKTYNTTYGLVTQELDPRNKATNYTYDTNNLYPATATNALNQQTQYTYDYSAGKPKQMTDPNTRVFQTVYDGLDRVTEEKQPDLTTPSTLVTKTTYVYTDTANAVSIKKADTPDGTASYDTYTYFDGLGRVIQIRKEAEEVCTCVGRFAVKDFVYNNRGLLEKESLPYFFADIYKSAPTSDSTLYSTYTYDPLNRITSVANAVGTTSNAYDDWKQTITDPRNKVKHLYKDAYGNLIKVDETNLGNTYTTNYEYNGNGNLTKITDALSNVRNFTYDGLSRRLTAQDLHSSADATFGTWTYTYDDAGNLSSVTDPKSQQIDYSYDDINRRLTENYIGQVGTEVTYTYDSGTDGVGRLTSVTATGANTSYVYNPLGAVKQETKTINATNYQTDYTLDRLGNVLEIANPDSSRVKYTHNNAGLIETVQRKESTDGGFINLITDFNYSPLEKVTYQAYTNGVTTTNTYDGTKMYRMTRKLTTLSGGTKMQDHNYTYDANGNITQIIDASQTNSSKTVDYVYDDLNRLTSATATNVASGQSTYTHTYTYDAIGNLLTRSDGAGTYSYAGNTGSRMENPHAVTSIGSINYTYDNNGNMLTETSGLSNTWDYNNRLTQAVKGAVTSTYDYDHEGQRVKLANGTTTTYYPSKFYNIEGTNRVKHIFAGDQLIATVKGTGASATVYSIHTDHLSGSNVVTNSGGTQEELMDYFAFGNIRLDEKAGTFSEQRKFAGSEYDTDTLLNYMNARYYDGNKGRFISQDPVFLFTGSSNFSSKWDLNWRDIKPGQLNYFGHSITDPSRVALTEYLSNPQNLNSYSYVINNPLRYKDPTGEVYVEFSFSGSYYGIGGAAGLRFHGGGIDFFADGGVSIGLGASAQLSVSSGKAPSSSEINVSRGLEGAYGYGLGIAQSGTYNPNKPLNPSNPKTEVSLLAGLGGSIYQQYSVLTVPLLKVDQNKPNRTENKPNNQITPQPYRQTVTPNNIKLPDLRIQSLPSYKKK